MLFIARGQSLFSTQPYTVVHTLYASPIANQHKIPHYHNATLVVAQQYKAKAQSNGEDIISPTIEQAAQAILDAAKK
jgi:hypothetical protein